MISIMGIAVYGLLVFYVSFFIYLVYTNRKALFRRR